MFSIDQVVQDFAENHKCEANAGLHIARACDRITPIELLGIQVQLRDFNDLHARFRAHIDPQTRSVSVYKDNY